MGEDQPHAGQNQRAGQAAYNLLAQTHPEIAEALLGTDADPFYDDSRLTLFHQRVKQMLDAPNPEQPE